MWLLNLVEEVQGNESEKHSPPAHLARPGNGTGKPPHRGYQLFPARREQRSRSASVTVTVNHFL